jgi:hypothetical protein
VATLAVAFPALRPTFLVGCGHPAGACLADVVFTAMSVITRANVICPYVRYHTDIGPSAAYFLKMRSPCHSPREVCCDSQRILDVITVDVSL